MGPAPRLRKSDRRDRKSGESAPGFDRRPERIGHIPGRIATIDQELGSRRVGALVGGQPEDELRGKFAFGQISASKPVVRLALFEVSDYLVVTVFRGPERTQRPGADAAVREKAVLGRERRSKDQNCQTKDHLCSLLF